LDNKDYQLERVHDSKIRRPKIGKEGTKMNHKFSKGDRVKLLDYDDVGLVYKEVDNYYNVVVYYKEQFMEVNSKRLVLELSATELYPEDYDLETLFVDYKERKLQHDIDRGSKKALRKIQKEMRRDNR